jgi:hypothetical protein
MRQFAQHHFPKILSFLSLRVFSSFFYLVFSEQQAGSQMGAPPENTRLPADEVPAING